MYIVIFSSHNFHSSQEHCIR